MVRQVQGESRDWSQVPSSKWESLDLNPEVVNVHIKAYDYSWRHYSLQISPSDHPSFDGSKVTLDSTSSKVAVSFGGVI